MTISPRSDHAARVAAALQENVDRIASDGAAESLVCHLLNGMADQLNARDAVYWRHDVALDRYEFVVAATWNAANQPRHRVEGSPPDWAQSHYMPRRRDGIGQRLRAGTVEVHQAGSEVGNGVRSFVAVPLFLRTEHLGAVVFGLANDGAEVDAELALALATQIALVQVGCRVTQEIAPPQSPLADTPRVPKMLHAVGANAQAMATLRDTEQLVPAALQAAVDVLGVRDGALWEHFEGEPIRMLLCVRHGRVLRPGELQELEGGHALTIGYLAAGFELSQDYLGAPPRSRRGIGVVDHSHPTALPGLDAFLVANGIPQELNVPLLVGAVAVGSLLVFQRADKDVPEKWRRLAEIVATQLAGALPLGRIASRTRVATVERERLAAINRANVALRHTAEKLAEASELRVFLEQVLRLLIDTFHGIGGSMWWGDDAGERMSIELDDGDTGTPASALHSNGARLDQLLAQVPGATQQMLEGRISMIDLAGLDWRAHLHSRSDLHAILVVPLMLGGRHFGCMSVQFTLARVLEDEDVELARALSTQAALAMELTRLTEDARLKATAEARAAELVKANEALRRTLDVLATANDADNALGYALSAITEHLCGAGGIAGLWLVDGDDSAARLRMALDSGVLVSPAAARFGDAPGSDALAESWRAAARMHAGQSSFLPVAEMSPIAAQTLKALDARGAIVLPMTLLQHTLGCFVVLVPEGKPDPSCDLMELGLALTHQATLVLQLSRLSEHAQRAAVAAEQRSAELVHAAKLTEANAALKRSLDLLASDSALDRFLGGVLQEISKRLAAERVVLFMASDLGQTLEPRIGWIRSSGGPRSATEATGQLTNDVLTQIASEQRTRRLPFLLRVEASQEISREQAEVLQSASVRAVLLLPLVLGDRILGSVAALLESPESPPIEDLELAHAFAHQATLALHLAKLSAASRTVAVLQERVRLAREVHDGIMQSFIGIAMQINGLRGVQASPRLDRAIELTEHGLAEARRAVRSLRSLHLDGKTFHEAVDDMARAAVGEGTRVTVTSSGIWDGLPADEESHLFRIVQEAVNNVVKHAQASELSIEMSANGSERSVLISDNGVGFNSKAAPREAESGFGLLSMRQRADDIGAAVSIVSRPGHGTQVFASIDLASRAGLPPTAVGTAD